MRIVGPGKYFGLDWYMVDQTEHNWVVLADPGEFLQDHQGTVLLGSISPRGVIRVKKRTGWRGERRRAAQLFLDDARRALVVRGDVQNQAVLRSIKDPKAQRAYEAKKYAMDLVTQRELGRGSPWFLPGVGELRPYASEIADSWDVALDAFLEAGLPLQVAFARENADRWRSEAYFPGRRR